jgi:hypothetical protein
MTSKKKAGANRQNALKCTGPKTPEGRAAVRLNALTHGLLSQQILLPNEESWSWCSLVNVSAPNCNPSET